MVLDQEVRSRNTNGLPKKIHRLSSMMQDIHDENGVEASVRVRKGLPIKRLHRDVARLSDQNVDPGDRDVLPRFLNRLPQRTVATPDVEDSRSAGDERKKPISENANPAWKDETLMSSAEKRHRRRIPRMLRKKLDSTVWNPRAVRVTPGITHRIVLP